GRLFGKKEITLSYSDSFFSLTKKPMAVEVKLLLQLYMVCFNSRLYGFHQPCATTLPCRRSIKLWNSFLLRFTAVKKLSIPAEDTPWASGVLCGRPVFCAQTGALCSRRIKPTNNKYLFIKAGKAMIKQFKKRNLEKK